MRYVSLRWASERSITLPGLLPSGIVMSPGLGHSPQKMCIIITPREKTSMLWLYAALGVSASGGINTAVPGAREVIISLLGLEGS